MKKSYYAAEPILPASAVAVLNGLNRDYLALLIAGQGEGVALLCDGVTRMLSAAAPAVLDSIAACSYALFTLEPALPRTVAIPQVNDPVTRRYGAEAGDAGAWSSFTTAALFFAWHLCRNSPVAARVMLGFTVATARALAALEPWQLRYCAVQQPAPLKPRWGDNPCFWPDLVRSAALAQPLEIDLARLLGLQLLAAEVQPGAAATNR